MRGEPYGPPAPFISRLERAAERAYTRTSPEPLDDPGAKWEPIATVPAETRTAPSRSSRLQVIHDGEPHWDHYSG
jgi:hypothetical protein